MKIEVDVDILEGVLDNAQWARNSLFDLLDSQYIEPGQECGFDEAWVGRCKNTTRVRNMKIKYASVVVSGPQDLVLILVRWYAEPQCVTYIGTTGEHWIHRNSKRGDA